MACSAVMAVLDPELYLSSITLRDRMPPLLGATEEATGESSAALSIGGAGLDDAGGAGRSGSGGDARPSVGNGLP